MRIIAGEFRSRRLFTPADGLTTRPMPDRVRESLFGILRGHTEGAAVFDAFAGTGSIGLEAISRGASRCVFVERDRDSVEILRRNIASLGVEDRCEVVHGDALGAGALARCPRPVHLVFMDPPYDLVRQPAGWRRVKAQFEQLVARLDESGFAVLRTPWPFRHRPADDTVTPAPPPKSRGRGKPGRGEEEEVVIVEARGDRGHAVDLAMEGAIGPETHVYHTTALHLYMRERGRF
jgi:16S rRNA (guanine(966)-N(2))-methyltransferase RsmD